MTKNKNTPNFLQGLKKMECLSEDNVPVISLNTSFGQIKSFSFGELSEFRFRTLLTKEPETITWINSFMKDSVFWDIGANIGIYSLYASLIEGIKVVSFEPSSFNYFLLNKNIFLNNKDKNIQALNIAFSDVNCLDIFYMHSAEVSYAENSFALEIDSFGEELHSVYRQDCLVFTVDYFIKQYL